jgi:ParB family chromosome partitioning protein
MTTVRSERSAGLGRGIAALIPQRPGAEQSPLEVPIDRIRPNPHQPRRRFDDQSLEILADSVREHGVLQPVVVTEVLDGYQVVAGERRLRAARLAGLDRVPVVVRQLADRQQLEVALVENVQRADLDPIEEAHAFRQLIDEFGLSHEDVASRIGRARSTVANTLRLLELHETVQTAVAEGQISEGHGRALGGLDTEAQARVLSTVIDRGLSVRDTEELVRRLREPRPARPTATRVPDPDLDRVEEELRRALGTKVRLARSRRGGRIVIEYYSEEELGRLYERLVGGGA